uniref:Integrase core domain containing protein n=1 Tax=Solanum tuberosum TaxID=4113 RepID=M1E028_SOLTU
MHVLILFSGIARLNSRRWIENWHVGPIGELGQARRTTQQFAKSPPITLNFMLYVLFDSVTFGEKPEVAKSTRQLTKNMVRTNLGGSGPPKKRRQELTPRDKGKRKKNIAKKVAADNQGQLSEPEEEQPLISRRDEIQAKSQTASTRVHLDAIPLATDLVPAQAPPVILMPPVVPHPRLLNRLKDDGL